MAEDASPPPPATPPPAPRRPYRLVAVIATLGIVALCLFPTPTPPGPEGLPLDKLGHLAAFALAAFLWHRSGLGAWRTLLVGATLAFSTEAAQGLLLVERRAEWADIAADLAGTGLGMSLSAHLMAPLRRLLARLVYGRRARRALAEARHDLATLPLPAAIERREQHPVAPQRRRLALRALASAIAQQQRREGDRAPCLPRTLALLSEARALGFAPRLVLGVKAPDEAFGAHAWLELDGRPFLEPAGTVERFVALPPMPRTPASR